MHKMIKENKNVIIITGFLIGLGYILELLPKTTTIMDLNENVVYVYMAIIVFAAYTFYSNYMQSLPVPHPTSRYVYQQQPQPYQQPYQRPQASPREQLLNDIERKIKEKEQKF